MRSARPSLTARWVAAHRTRLARTRPSTPSGDVAGEQALDRAVSGAFAVPVGRATGLAERTRFVDNEVARALGHGVDQVVLLGAGYDGRALRFASETTRWFEVDLPATQADKRRSLAALGLAPQGVTYVGLDLMRADLGQALEDAGHDASRPSVFVCEGLFAYLTLEAVASVCQALYDRAPAGSVLVTTFLVVPAAGSLGQALRTVVDQLLRVIGEVRRSEYLEGDAEKLMVVTGWQVARSASSPPGRLGQGSHLLALAAEPAPSR